jgi:hypothetical protein
MTLCGDGGDGLFDFTRTLHFWHHTTLPTLEDIRVQFLILGVFILVYMDKFEPRSKNMHFRIYFSNSGKAYQNTITRPSHGDDHRVECSQSLRLWIGLCCATSRAHLMLTATVKVYYVAIGSALLGPRG